MKRSRFTEEQIIGILKAHQADSELSRSTVNLATIRLKQMEQGLTYQRLKGRMDRDLRERRKSDLRIVAPIDGTILEIRYQVGQEIDRGPVIIRMADLSPMYVTCEVFEGDLLKIRRGMKATATSSSLPEALEGVVVNIERTVQTNRKLGTVLIRLHQTELAERLIGMEVQVTIHQ